MWAYQSAIAIFTDILAACYLQKTSCDSVSILSASHIIIIIIISYILLYLLTDLPTAVVHY